VNSLDQRRFITVAGIASMAVAFAIVVALLLGTSSAGNSGPRIGDHWHAPYEIYIGGQLQPPLPEIVTPEGIHTHGDGIIHVHPHITAAEGKGASLANFFSDQGGLLTASELHLPVIDIDSPGSGRFNEAPSDALHILRADSGIHPLGAGFAAASEVCRGLLASEFVEVGPEYVPQDGDCIRIIFGEPPS
jgi:hypothetical protein